MINSVMKSANRNYLLFYMQEPPEQTVPAA